MTTWAVITEQAVAPDPQVLRGQCKQSLSVQNQWLADRGGQGKLLPEKVTQATFPSLT